MRARSNISNVQVSSDLGSWNILLSRALGLDLGYLQKADDAKSSVLLSKLVRYSSSTNPYLFWCIYALNESTLLSDLESAFPYGKYDGSDREARVGCGGFFHYTSNTAGRSQSTTLLESSNSVKAYSMIMCRKNFLLSRIKESCVSQ